MSDKLGPRVFGHDHSQPFLGLHISAKSQHSQASARQIDDEIRRIVEATHKRAIANSSRPPPELGSAVKSAASTRDTRARAVPRPAPPRRRGARRVARGAAVDGRPRREELGPRCDRASLVLPASEAALPVVESALHGRCTGWARSKRPRRLRTDRPHGGRRRGTVRSGHTTSPTETTPSGVPAFAAASRDERHLQATPHGRCAAATAGSNLCSFPPVGRDRRVVPTTNSTIAVATWSRQPWRFIAARSTPLPHEPCPRFSVASKRHSERTRS